MSSHKVEQVPPEGDSFLYVDISSIDRERKAVAIIEPLPTSSAPSRARQRLRADDVLVSMTRPNLNAVAIVPAHLEGATGSTGFDVLRSIGTEPRWLFAHVRSPWFVDEMSSLVQGALYPAVKSAEVRSSRIPVPPLAEQKRIVARIAALQRRSDAAKEALVAIQPLLEKFRRSVLAAAFRGDLTREWRTKHPDVESASELLRRIGAERSRQGLASATRVIRDEGIAIPQSELPTKWEWCRLGQIADVRLGGTPSRAGPEYWGGAVPWVSSGEVANCRIARTRESITKAGIQGSNAKIYPRGTVLIAMIGEGKTRGQSAILDLDAATNQNVAGLVFDVGPISGEYIWLWALSQYEQNRGVGVGGNQPALNAAKVRALPVPIPPLDEQAEIIRCVQGLLSYVDRLETGHAAMSAQGARLMPALLSKAFRGELVPQDPNDEPASALLERIRAARGRANSKAGSRRNQAP